MTASKSQFFASSSILGLLAASSSDAAIITNTSLGLEGLTVEGGSFDFAIWNVDGVDSNEFSFSASNISTPGWTMPGYWGGPYHSWYIPGTFFPGFSSHWIRAVGSGGEFAVEDNQLLAIPEGGIVGPSLAFSSGYLYPLSNGDIYAPGFSNGVPGYIGFQFQKNGATLYGWAEVVMTSGEKFGDFQINSWAFDDTGAPIQVGVVPEPAATGVGLGALALGAAGVIRWRKNRAQQRPLAE